MNKDFHAVIKFCEICKERLVLRNNRDIVRKRFCKKSCQHIYCGRLSTERSKKKQMIRICLTCKREFATVPSLNGKFCSDFCFNNRPIVAWKEHGYLKMPDRATGRVRVAQHVLIAEKVLGRRLRSGEVVHHINLNKSDNRNRNLLICSSNYHSWLHNQYQRRYAELYLRF